MLKMWSYLFTKDYFNSFSYGQILGPTDSAFPLDAGLGTIADVQNWKEKNNVVMRFINNNNNYIDRALYTGVSKRTSGLSK